MADAVQSILPSNSTAWERAVEQVSAERWPDVDVDIIRRAKSPWECPEHLLPFLAHELSVDLWDDRWDVEKKRRVIARSIDMHRKKGTKTGIFNAVELMGARVIDDITFPSRAFVSATITKAQRDGWLARMPQIRIYYVNGRGVRGQEAFLRPDPSLGGRSSYVGHAFARADDAWKIYGRRSVLRAPDGSETPLRHVEIIDREAPRGIDVVDQVRIVGNGRPGTFVGRFARGRFLAAGKKQPRTATVRVRESTGRHRELHWSTLQHGFDPIDLEYRIESDVYFMKGASFGGRYPRRFLRRDEAAERLFQMIHLHDPDVDAPWVRAHSFVGRARTPKPAFHSEMLVEALVKAGRRSAFVGRSIVGQHYTADQNLEKFRAALLAGRKFKAARDRVHFDTRTRRPLRFSDRPRLDGSIQFDRPVVRAL